MKKLSIISSKILTLLFIMSSLNLFSQKPSDIINPSAINYQLVDKLFNQKLNELRKSKNAQELSGDDILVKAAKDQASYMAVNDTLTHFQKIKNKKIPQDRVKFYKGTHDGVGENCVYTFLFTPIVKKGRRDTVRINTYQQLAEQIFQSWKNSPGHYKNMVDPKYDVQGISFEFVPTTNKLYSAQVFGMKPYTYSKKVENLIVDYPLKPYDVTICKSIEMEKINGIRIANRLIIEGNKVYLFSQNLKGFEKAFSSKDQIALDIVFKDQFVCDKNNLLNGSPYYDGIMLNPVNFKEIFLRNEDKKNGRLYSYVCDLPKEIDKLDFQLNVIIIKNSCFCSYTYPVKIDHRDYKLINLQPYWDTIKIVLSPDTFKETIRQKIHFEKGSSSFNPNDLVATQRKLLDFNPYVKSIILNAYSSVEGDTLINERLGRERAENVLKELNFYLPKEMNVNISFNENWELFYTQIKGTKFEYLSGLNKSKVKRMIRDSLHKKIDSMLVQERYSEFEIEIEGVHHNTSAEFLSLGIKKAIANNDYSLAHILQSKIIYKYLKDSADISYISNYPLNGYSYSDVADPLPYFVNLLAAKCIDENSDDFNDSRKLKEMFKNFSFSKRARYNYCIYAIKYWSTKMDTLVNPDELLKLINNCKALVPKSAVNSMLLNYYLVSVEYYNKINDYNKMVSSLDNIYDLFKSVKLDESSSYKLALYFCKYNMTNWAIELLEPHMKTCNKEPIIHLYLEAGAVEYQKDYKKNGYIDVVDKYHGLFPSQFNSWIKEEYQLLREPMFKNRFCDMKLK